MAGHGTEHGGHGGEDHGHDAHGGDHGHGAEHGGKKEGFWKKVKGLKKIVTFSALLLFLYGDIAKPMTINPIKNSVESGMGFVKGGGGSHGGSHGGGAHGHH